MYQFTYFNKQASFTRNTFHFHSDLKKISILPLFMAPKLTSRAVGLSLPPHPKFWQLNRRKTFPFKLPLITQATGFSDLPALTSIPLFRRTSFSDFFLDWVILGRQLVKCACRNLCSFLQAGHGNFALKYLLYDT